MSDQAFQQAYQLHRAGQLDQALAGYRALLDADPDNAELHHLIAVIAVQQGRAADAAASARRAADLQPGHAKAWNTLGNALFALKDVDGARRAFEQAVAAAPDFADGHYNLGNIAAAEHDFEAAIEHFQHAARLQPADPRPLNNWGHALLKTNRTAEAVPVLQRAVEAAPAFADARINLGMAYTLTNRPGDAVRMLSDLPESAAQQANLGNALESLGRMDEAVAAMRKAMAAAPDNVTVHHNLLVTLPFMDGVSAEQVAGEFRKFGDMREPAAAARRKPWNVDRDPDRKLRIAYLAPFLCRHVLAQNIAPVLRNHHRDQVHVSVYAHVPAPDDATRQMQADVDAWTFIHAMTDDQAAQRIRDDRIDVLIHPMGHWRDNRLMICAQKPAPVQISYLCNSPSTGLSAFDGLIVDRHLDFDGSIAALCREPLIHLPGGFQVTEYVVEPEIGPPPCLTNGFATFGSFNNPAKLSDACLDLWAAVLHAVPDSKLLLKGGGMNDSVLSERIAGRLAARGIAAARVDFMGRVPEYADHLRMIGSVDVVLDTTPFTGGRTSEDALWMGVPVVALLGQAVYGRFTAAHLHRIGRPETIARSPDEYVKIARDLAASPDRLTEYRRILRPAMKASGIMDFDGHCRDLENACRDLWRKYCAS